MVSMIVATGAGVALYAYIQSGGLTSATAIEVKQEPDIKMVKNKESIFTFYKIPRAMPKLNFVDGNQGAVTLEAFQGSVVLLNIWATWCLPCREEMPALDRLQAKLGGPNFAVVALSIDRGPSSMIANFYEEFGIKALALYHDPTGEVSYALPVAGIPTTFLIDRNGNGLGLIVGPVKWDSPEIVQELTGYLALNNKENNL